MTSSKGLKSADAVVPSARAVKETRDNARIGAGKPGPGRPKGSQNKLTKSAKEAFQAAFDSLGGAAGLASWAKDEPGEFYKLYARLIPVDHAVEEITVNHTATDRDVARRLAFLFTKGLREHP